MYLNAQNILKKIDELRVNVNIVNPDVIIIVEAWTNDAISDEFLCIKDYELLERKDRNDTMGGRGGGLLAYVKNDLCAWKEEINSNFNQGGTIKLKMKEKGELIIHIMYRSPNSTKDNDHELCEWIKTMKGEYIIIGDFNYPAIDWETSRSDVKGK